MTSRLRRGPRGPSTPARGGVGIHGPSYASDFAAEIG